MYISMHSIGCQKWLNDSKSYNLGKTCTLMREWNLKWQIKSLYYKNGLKLTDPLKGWGMKVGAHHTLRTTGPKIRKWIWF